MSLTGGKKQQIERLRKAKKHCLDKLKYSGIKIPKKYINEYYKKVYNNREKLRVDLEIDFIQNNILAVSCSNYLNNELYKYYVGAYEYRYSPEQNYIAFHFDKCRNTKTGFIKDSYNKCTYLPSAPVKFYHGKYNSAFHQVIKSTKLERKVSLYNAIKERINLSINNNILV